MTDLASQEFERRVASHLANAMEYGPLRVTIAASSLRIEARIHRQPARIVDHQEQRAIAWLATEDR